MEKMQIDYCKSYGNWCDAVWYWSGDYSITECFWIVPGTLDLDA